MRYEGFCPVTPVPKGRPRGTKDGHHYTPKATRDYERAVRQWLALTFPRAEPLDGTLRLVCEFVMPRVSGTRKTDWYKNKKPDADNLLKAFQDAIMFQSDSSAGRPYGLLVEDSRVVATTMVKRFASEGEECGTRFLLEPIDDRVIVSDGTRDGLPVAAVIDPSLRRMGIDEMRSMRPDRAIRTAYAMCTLTSADERRDFVREARRAFPEAEHLYLI